MEVESSEQVHAEIARLAGEAMFTEEEIGTTCCFATQDKVWVTGPGGERWEVYTVLADSETFFGCLSRAAADAARPDAAASVNSTVQDETHVRSDFPH